MYLQELEAVPVPEHLIDYIDYEAYGRDVRINEDGHLAPGGYVVGGGSFVEHYPRSAPTADRPDGSARQYSRTRPGACGAGA